MKTNKMIQKLYEHVECLEFNVDNNNSLTNEQLSELVNLLDKVIVKLQNYDDAVNNFKQDIKSYDLP